MKKLFIKKDKRGVFGLTAIQSFFAIILGLGLLAYVIVVIMGTLSETSILTSATGNTTDTGVIPTDAGTDMDPITYSNPTCTIEKVVNFSGAITLASGNYSGAGTGGCKIKNLTSEYIGAGGKWNVTVSWTYDTPSQEASRTILNQTGEGVTGFFEDVNPVYAILAVLVIILVLVVLVRVVAPKSGQGMAPQL